MEHIFEVVKDAMPLLLTGMMLTLKVTVISLVIAVFIGLLSCMMGISKNPILSFISKAYVYIIRGTPLIVQVFFLYFGVASAFEIRIDKITVGIIAICLNAGAYMSEIYRGSIQSVNKGQMEAARSLGLPYGKAMVKVILPQAFRMSVPALTNQVIISFKDVSLLSVIAIPEIVQQARMYIGSNFEPTLIWVLVGVMYLIIVAILTNVSRLIERKMVYAKGKNKKSA